LEPGAEQNIPEIFGDVVSWWLASASDGYLVQEWIGSLYFSCVVLKYAHARD